MRKSAFLLSSLLAWSAGAQTVHLKGLVSNTAGQPVSGAIVVLTGLGLKDTTGSDGTYALDRISTAIGPRQFTGAPRLEGGVLSFELNTAAPVRVEIRDLTGSLRASIRREGLAPGSHRLALPELGRGTGLQLVQVSIGEERASFRVVSSSEGALPTGAPAVLARAAAVVDTLRVSATGYQSQAVAVPSYEQTLDVRLSALATCNPSEKTPDPISVNVTNSGAALTGSHQVVVETDPSLSGRTIYRPKDLGPGKNYPILVWGNGGCSNNATDHTDYHLEIASHGYVIVADGTPKGTGGRAMVDVTTMGAPQIAALTWAIQQNAKPCSRFYQSLDTLHSGGFGWSCGGLMTYGLTLGGRVTTSIIMNSGLLSPDQSTLDKVRTPIAYVCGGSGDMAYANGQRDYTNIKTVPTVFANVGVGHGGTYYADNGGEYAKFARAWFDWWLKGDLGATGKQRFTDPQSPFFKSPWTMQTKRLP